MSKHQKILSFESSLDDINPKENEESVDHNTYQMSDRMFGCKEGHAPQDDSVLRDTRIHEEEDVG